MDVGVHLDWSFWSFHGSGKLGVVYRAHTCIHRFWNARWSKCCFVIPLW